MAKISIRAGINMSIKNALNIENYLYQLLLSTHDKQEGLKAYKEKRIPIFKGF
jgi:hypothetical protein